jgi:hypothetical protein
MLLCCHARAVAYLKLARIGKGMEKFSGAEPERIEDATLSLAVSASLKCRIDTAAKMENVSVDTWALRVMEEALRSAPAVTNGPMRVTNGCFEASLA